MNQSFNILDLLKGKKVNYETDAKIVVQLEIKSVKETQHSKDLAPSTRENDWWPPSMDWTTFDVEFTNGFKKSYYSLSEINIVQDEPTI